MKTWMFIICLLTTFSSVSFAQSPRPFLLNQIVYPSIDDYSKLFIEIYTELGFQVELIPTPSLRGLILLNNNVFDADVLRLNLIAKTYPNVIVVQPALQIASLSLICTKAVLCNRSILTNKKISILANSRMLALIKHGEFKSVHVENELFSSVLNMLKADRYNYAIYVIDDVIEKHFDQDFQIIELRKVYINHVIHKKHIDLLPQIQQKIRSKLPRIISNRLKKAIPNN
jgi:hypothetical protein